MTGISPSISAMGLVYFGYPRAHEDDAQRAVRAGLGMIEAVGQLIDVSPRSAGCSWPCASIHTGLVVVGEVGGGTRQEQLALGETPNLAARLQGIAAPNTLVIERCHVSAPRGLLAACQPLGTPLWKGLAQPLALCRMLYEEVWPAVAWKRSAAPGGRHSWARSRKSPCCASAGRR